MELRQLNTLIRVAQFKSFSRAAESLGYSQSAVTVQIRQLEEELNTRLFDRMGKRIALTTQGEQFLEHAYEVINQVNRARLSLSGDEELHGRLHIGVIESLCVSKLPAVLRCFWTRHPKVVVRVTTGELEDLIEEMFYRGGISYNDELYITSARQKEALIHAVSSLEQVKNSIAQDMPEDFYSIDLMNAYTELGYILGEEVDEDLVNEIFSKFCMGK